MDDISYECRPIAKAYGGGTMKNDAIIIIFTVCAVALAIFGTMAIFVSADNTFPEPATIPSIPALPHYPTVIPQIPPFPHIFPKPTATVTPTPTPTPEPTLTPTPTTEPSITPTPAPEPTLTPTPLPSVTPLPSASVTPEVNGPAPTETPPVSDYTMSQPSTTPGGALTTPLPSPISTPTTVPDTKKANVGLPSWQLLMLFLLGVVALVVCVRSTMKK